MKRTCLGLIAAAMVQMTCFAKVTKLPQEHRNVLEKSSLFHEVLTTNQLPPSIVALCADTEGKLAEPGQKWQVSCVTMDEKLPRKRLIWAGVSGEYHVMHYEGGGIGHSFHVLVATLAKGAAKPKIVWHGVGDKLKDYAAFLRALRTGELDDTFDYAH